MLSPRPREEHPGEGADPLRPGTETIRPEVQKLGVCRSITAFGFCFYTFSFETRSYSVDEAGDSELIILPRLASESQPSLCLRL